MTFDILTRNTKTHRGQTDRQTDNHPNILDKTPELNLSILLFSLLEFLSLNTKNKCCCCFFFPTQTDVSCYWCLFDKIYENPNSE